MYGAPPAVLQQMDPEDCRVAVNARCAFDELKRSRYGYKAVQQRPEWSNSESDSYLREHYENLMKPDFAPDVVAALQPSVDKYGVICFSIDGDIPTQWQNYASQGQGVCLELDPFEDLDWRQPGVGVFLADPACVG